jgi:cysteinyl-tRNA synthetase
MPHPISLYNTATRSIEAFTPARNIVTMYHCGPTVYNTAHIGNLRAYVFADVLRRTIEEAGYQVKQVINITDVGHLVGDGDDGEDKMTSALKREGLPLSKDAMTALGRRYTDLFFSDLKKLNILPAHVHPRASDHIAEDTALVETLLANGHAYTTNDGIYFDTSTFPDYANLARLDLTGMRQGERVDVGDKRHGADFALWKFDDTLGYESTLGKGFPGWHVECSAMIKAHLGHPIDIHTGGVDHIPVHHTNEIAQSVCAYGAPFVSTWMHSAHMTVDGAKMSKSLGNTHTLDDLEIEGVTPLGFRYWLLTASYRTQINFTWDAVRGAQEAYNKLRQKLAHININDSTLHARVAVGLTGAFEDLNTAEMIAQIHSFVHGGSIPQSVHDEIRRADAILGLDLCSYTPPQVEATDEVNALLQLRQRARDNKDFAESDRLRDLIREHGFIVKDTKDGQVLET